MSKRWRGNGAEEDRNCDGGCIESDLERVGEECKNDREKELETTGRERSKRKVRGRKKTMEKEIMVNSCTPDDSDAKKIITKKCNLTQV